MFTNWIHELLGLSDKIFGLMEKTAANANVEVTAQDSRLVALSGMQETVLSCGFWLNIYHSIAENHQNESMVLKYAGSNLSLEHTAKIMLNQIRLGLVMFFHFKLENLLGSLLNNISSKKISSLGETFNELSKEINLSDIPKKAEIIKAFSSIRNSLHNNGIHNKESFSVKVGKFDYEFSKGDVVQCASLEHCITLIQAITDIIESVLASDKIKEINGIIPDTYAEWLDKNNA
jgi:hypothetical protein